ncbi:hypothetical protein DRP04_12855 [Archaeoglobales archaeon]|nr:MAG: hypothetical protein DRP04_12855 [Archaeoglobales archaeon]
MDTLKIFQDLKKMLIDVAYVENVSNTIVLASTHTDEEIKQIEDYLRENGLNYQIINPQPIEEELFV